MSKTTSSFILILISVIVALSGWYFYQETQSTVKSETISIYNFSVKTINGTTIKMNDFKGKTLLIVNVASDCGFTNQYEGLEQLYQKYKSKGFIVLGFPCNQFGGQEQGSNDEIHSFCTKKFDVTFPMFSKVQVNGENADQLFEFLKNEQPGILNTKGIKWNFTKFLVDSTGKVLQRFSPYEEPKSFESQIIAIL